MLFLHGQDVFEQSPRGGVIGPDPSDDLLVGSDRDALSHQVLLDHVYEIAAGRVLGVTSFGQCSRVEIRRTLELDNPCRNHLGMALLLRGVLQELLSHGTGTDSFSHVVVALVPQNAHELGGQNLVQDREQTSTVCTVGLSDGTLLQVLAGLPPKGRNVCKGLIHANMLSRGDDGIPISSFKCNGTEERDPSMRGVEAAFFDLDKTVIAKASVAAFGKPFYDDGLISRTTILRMLYAHLIYLQLGAGEEKLARIRDSMLSLTKGWDQARVNEIVRETLHDVVDPIIFPEALELIDLHHQAGRQVFFISASPEEIVSPLAQYLGADGCIASRARLDDEGRYTGEMDFYAYGPSKAKAITDLARARDIDLTASFAYSDSLTDLPMLEAVGHPVAVNPDRGLAAIARERHWETRDFRAPSKPGPRISSPSWVATGATVIAVIGVGAVVVGRNIASRRRAGVFSLA